MPILLSSFRWLTGGVVVPPEAQGTLWKFLLAIWGCGEHPTCLTYLHGATEVAVAVAARKQRYGRQERPPIFVLGATPPALPIHVPRRCRLLRSKRTYITYLFVALRWLL